MEDHEALHEWLHGVKGNRDPITSASKRFFEHVEQTSAQRPALCTYMWPHNKNMALETKISQTQTSEACVYAILDLGNSCCKES